MPKIRQGFEHMAFVIRSTLTYLITFEALLIVDAEDERETIDNLFDCSDTRTPIASGIANKFKLITIVSCFTFYFPLFLMMLLLMLFPVFDDVVVCASGSSCQHTRSMPKEKEKD
ncbi:hypothetical protein LXL04_016346 [Taraxacum kok-saghyz]